MSSKVRTISILVVFSLFLFSMGGEAAHVNPVRSVAMTPAFEADPVPGETHIYNITSAEFPFGMILQQEGVDIAGTFAGSKIYVKVLRDEASPEILTDAFQTGMFFVLGSDLTVAFQPNFENYTEIPEDLREITIPGGLAFPLGEQLSWIAGSGFWPENNDTENEDDYFLPFYAENFLLLQAAIISEGGTAEIVGSDLTGSWSEVDDEGVSTEWTATWSEDEGGLITEFSIEVTDGTETVSGTAKYLETENRPLPSTLTPGSTHTYKVEKAELDIQVNDLLRSFLSGDTTDPEYEPFNEAEIEQQVRSMKDQTILEFTVNSIDGVFYNITPSVYDEETQSLTTQVDWVIINGFSGEIWDEAETGNLLLEDEDNGFSAPPALTPDWELWSGLVGGAGNLIASELLQFLRSHDFEDLILEGMQEGEDPLPITSLDYNIDLGVDWTTENGIHYASSFFDVFVEVEAHDEDAGMTINVDVDAQATGWLAFQDSGILVGAGVSANGGVLGKFKAGGLEGTLEGNINELEIKIKNTAMTTALNEPVNPGGERHPEESESEAIPGFTFLWILMIFVSVSIFIRKRSN